MTIYLGKLVLGDKIVDGAVQVAGEKISKVYTKQSGFQKNEEREKIVDMKDHYILPGFIETHGHMREPGLEHKEDIPHGTKAAIVGGVTTILDMPNTNPPTTTVDLFLKKLKLYENRSYSDYGINFGTSVNDLLELEKIDPKKIIGAKVFTAGHETTPTTIPNLGDQAKIWEIAARRDFPVLVHAENQQLVTFRENYFKTKGKKDMDAYSEARNWLVVGTAAWEAVLLAKQYGTRLWLLHASTKPEFDAVEWGKSNKVDIESEVTVYQLYFNTEDYKRLGTKIKVSPAIRSPAEQKYLWDMVKAGKIAGLCAEHTPHTLEEKNKDVWQAASGTPGIQESSSAFLSAWIKRFGSKNIEEGIIRLANMYSSNIADFFDLEQKGKIAAGKDADLIFINPENKWLVKKEELYTKLKWSPYEGDTLIGTPSTVIRRGEVMIENRKFIGKQTGKWIHER